MFSKESCIKISSLVLSPTALEVLAIIAYKQPVSKTEIERRIKILNETIWFTNMSRETGQKKNY